METLCAELGPGVDPRSLLEELRERHPRLVIQLVSLRSAPSAAAVAMIGAQTARAMEEGSLLAEKPELDLLLRMAGTTQISEAIGRAGYGGRGRRLLIALGRDEDLSALRAGLGDGLKILERGRASREDLDLVERAALLAAGRA